MYIFEFWLSGVEPTVIYLALSTNKLYETKYYLFLSYFQNLKIDYELYLIELSRHRQRRQFPISDYLVIILELQFYLTQFYRLYLFY